MDTVTRMVDNTGAGRYEIWEGPEQIGHLDYRHDGGVVALLHVAVEPAHGGHGHAAALTRFALDAAHETGVEIDPVCPFVAGYIERNPQYAHLVTGR